MQFLQPFADPAFYAMLLTGFLFLIGLLGSFLPILPGTVIIWAGIIIHKLWMGPGSVSWTAVGIATGLMLVSLIADYACSAWGAQRFGASWRGAAGAIVGGIIALFIPPQLLTIIIGPFIGAVLAEFLGGSLSRDALRAGVGTVVGGLVAFALKLSLAVSMIIGFYFLLP